MTLFIHDLRENLAKLDNNLQSDFQKLKGDWFKKGKIFLEHIEEEDIRILADFKKLHKKAKDANPKLAEELLKKAKLILFNLTIIIKKIEKGQFGDFEETSKEAQLLKRAINELHQMLQRELDPKEILRVIHLRKRFLEGEEYLKIYNRFFGPDHHPSPLFLDPESLIVYINAEEKIPSQYLNYMLIHEAWEHRVYILAYHEHPKYKMLPYAITLDQIEDAIDLRSHEIATFEEFLAAKRDGKLDEYFEWMKINQYNKVLEEVNDDHFLRKKIEGRFRIKLNIYKHVKKEKI